MARNVQPHSIVFAITGVGQADGTQHGRVESAGRTQSVDAQSVVSAVVGCPFFVVDNAWGKFVQVEVGHHIRTNHHRALLLVEGIDDGLQRVFVLIKVVAV